MRDTPEGEFPNELVPADFLEDLRRAFPFPEPERTDSDGLLAYGGDLAAERLLAAYAQGVFPWYDRPPILWHSPDPRAVLYPDALRINRSLARALRRGRYRITMDTHFRAVLDACSTIQRPGQQGTWINADMIEAYCELHDMGFAHSVEAWEGEQLVGGIYGPSLGAAFFGESMFARRSNASKVALVALMARLRYWGFHFLDCQVHTDQSEGLGAILEPRPVFLSALKKALQLPTRRGRWRPLAATEVE